MWSILKTIATLIWSESTESVSHIKWFNWFIIFYSAIGYYQIKYIFKMHSIWYVFILNTDTIFTLDTTWSWQILYGVSADALPMGMSSQGLGKTGGSVGAGRVGSVVQ